MPMAAPRLRSHLGLGRRRRRVDKKVTIEVEWPPTGHGQGLLEDRVSTGIAPGVKIRKLVDHGRPEGRTGIAQQVCRAEVQS
jgi:hypothetical protein